MAPSTEDNEAALSGMLTADHRVGALRTVGKGKDAVADGWAVEGCVHLHHHLVLPMDCFALKDATVHGGQ